MRTSAQSSLATVLLLIPILAVPMFAIFGVPQFTPTVKSPFEEETSSRRKNESEAPAFSPTSSERDSFDQFASNAADSMPTWGDDTADRAAKTLADRRANAKPERSSREASRTEPTEPSPFAMASGTENAGVVVPGSYRRSRPTNDTVDAPPRKVTHRDPPTAMDSQLTWRDAVQRLNAMGIRNFRLEPGHQPSQFLFNCSYTPRDNPRVSYRFEAEADEPLRAVERVLEQIDTWLAAR
jgi:hypothetical protein